MVCPDTGCLTEEIKMKINAGNVAMESNHSYNSSGLSLHVVKDMSREEAARLDISSEGRSYLSVLSDPDRESKNSGKNKDAGLALSLLEKTRKTGNANRVCPAEEESPEIKALKQILEMMKRWAKGDYSYKAIDFMKYDKRSHSSSYSLGVSDGSAVNFFRSQNSGSFSAFIGAEAADLRSNAVIAQGNGRLMTRVTASYDVINESEYTAFKTVGKALTDDGREINFNVEFGMSRSFSAAFQSLSKEDFSVALCDPLVINAGADVADISDKKFFFDLDSDGNEEEISALGKGSGFLAIDKNNDNRINDGSELFGTKSGDGFKDLSYYDSDHNGWIDEGDAIFNRLKIWYADGEGSEKLISLKEAGIGAIYLGNADTEFSDKNAVTGALNGVIRKTGIFLRENGNVGTLQHVDLAL